MLDFLLLVAITDVILILVVPEGVWLTIHRTTRKWVAAGVAKIKAMSN